MIEIKVPKEIRSHSESIVFGLTARQFICSVLAVAIAVFAYLILSPLLGQESASWLCILLAAPMAAAGFFRYNGMTLEQFLWAFIKSELLCAASRKYIARNLHYEAMGRKKADDFD